MRWEYTPYALPLCVAAAISIALALTAWQRRTARGAPSFALLTGAVAEWSLGYGLELISADLPTKILWAKIQYLGVVTVPAAWLVFALQYAGQERRLDKHGLAVLTVEPITTLLLVWTNEAHHLIWSSTTLNFDGPIPMLEVTYGPFFWIHTGYSYLLLLLGTILLVWTVFHQPSLYRGQVVAVLAGVLVPWLGTVLYIFIGDSLPSLGLPPLLLTVTDLVLALGLFRYRLLDVMPVAHDAIVKGMSEGVIVLDERSRVVYLNPAAERIVGRSTSEVVGQAISRVLPAWSNWTEHYRGDAGRCKRVVLREGETRSVYELCVTPLRGRQGVVTGHVAVFRDITERERAESALRRWADRLAAISEASRAFAALQPPEEIYSRLPALLRQATDFDRMAIYLYDPATDSLRLVVHEGLTPEEAEAAERTAMDRHPGWVLRSRQSILVPETSHHMRVSYERTLHRSASVVFAPIVHGDRALGVIGLGSDRPGAYDETDLALLETVAGYIAVALENARLYKETQTLAERLSRENRYLAILNRIVHLAASTLELRDLLQAMADTMAEVIGGDGCYVTLWDEETRRTIPAAAYGSFRETYPQMEVRPDDVTLTESVAREGGPLAIEDVFNTPYLSPRIATLFPARSVLALPMRVGERTLGAVIIAFNTPHAFTEEEIARAAQAVERAAVAVEKAILFQQVRQERERLDAALRSTGDAVFLLDADLRFLLVNPAAEVLLGAPKEDLRGRLAADAGPVAKAVVETLSGLERPPDSPLRFDIRSEGRDLRGSVAPVRDPSGGIQGWVVTVRDVTDLTELSRFRARMLDIATHDLKNPLHLARNYLALLLEEVDPQTDLQKDLAQRLKRSLDQMEELILGILDMARLRQEGVRWERIRWPQLVAETVEELRPWIEEKRLEVRQEVPEDLPQTEGDEVQLRRALYNLLDNAVKYTPTGGRIAVRAWVASETLFIAVSDTGPGIPPELLPRLFKPAPPPGGRAEGVRRTGLGLTLVREVVEAHGGRVWAESTPQGSTFTIALPIT